MKTLQISIAEPYPYFHDAKILAHSIQRQASIGVDIRFVPGHEQLLSRVKDATQTNPFSYTRFLAPYLWSFDGPVLYMDPDMLCLCDIKEVFDLFDPQYAVQVVKHDYTPKLKTKWVNDRLVDQYVYPRKNWSSLMLFNSEKCRDIYTLKSVNFLAGLTLHQFANLGDNEIGSLPKEYNYLVGEDNQAEQAKIIHFTNGMPYVNRQCEYSDQWREEATSYLLHSVGT